MNKKVKKEAWDLLKGAVGAAITAGVLAFLQYLGTYIPEMLQSLSMVAGAVIGIKTRLG